MKAESAAVAKVRLTQSFDIEHTDECWNHRRTDATHVGTVLVEGRQIVRVPLCDECARSWKAEAPR